MIKQSILAILLILCHISGYSQVHILTIDDTLFLTKSTRTLTGGNIFEYDLKDSLPDGMYYLYFQPKTDSMPIDSAKLIMTGQYHNHKRVGVFYYYYGPWENAPYPFERQSYSNGLLSGLNYRSSVRKEMQLSYESGRLCGLSLVHNELICKKRKLFRTRYEYKTYISFIIHFSNDSVIQWMQMQPEITFVYRNGQGNINGERCETEEYDNNGFLKFLYSFEDGVLVRVDQYASDGLITRRYNYDKPKNSDQQSQSSYIQIFNEIEFVIVNYTPINGSIEELDPMGRIISRKSFINNVVQ